MQFQLQHCNSSKVQLCALARGSRELGPLPLARPARPSAPLGRCAAALPAAVTPAVPALHAGWGLLDVRVPLQVLVHHVSLWQVAVTIASPPLIPAGMHSQAAGREDERCGIFARFGPRGLVAAAAPREPPYHMMPCLNAAEQLTKTGTPGRPPGRGSC